MKSNIWYYLIVFFVIMIFIPPLLRFAIPKDESQTPVKTPTQSTIKRLTCKDNDGMYEITNNYSDGNLISLVFTSDIFNDESILENEDEMITYMKDLKLITNASLNDNRLVFNFNNNNFSEVEQLQRFIRDIDTQKAYYEQLGLNCSVSE